MKGMSKYRVSFETINPHRLGRYSDADPTFYKNTTQLVPNSKIPEEEWRLVSRVTDDFVSAMSQYENLKKFHDADTGFVRNPRLEESSEPEWKEIKP